MALHLRAAPQANVIQLQIGGALDLNLRMAQDEGFTLITARYEQFVAIAKGNQMAYNLPSGKKLGLAVAYFDANNNPAVVDGEVTWSSSDETLIAVQVDGTDSSKCTIHTAGPLGTAQVTAKADADLGQGVRELLTIFDVTVVAGEAVAGRITPTGDPEDQ